MSVGHTGAQVTDNEEHISLGGVNAKAVVHFGYNGAGLTEAAAPFIDLPFDYIAWTSPDVNGNYQTITFRLGGAAGTVQRTLSATYDGSNNLTSLGRS